MSIEQIILQERLAKQVTELGGLCEDLKKQVIEKDDLISSLQNDLQQLNFSTSEKEIQAIQLHQQIRDLQDAVDSKEIHITNLQNNRAETTEYIAELVRGWEAERSNHEVILQNHQKLKMEFMHLEKKNILLQEQWDNAKNEIRQKEDEIESLNHKLLQTQKQNLQMHLTLTSLQSTKTLISENDVPAEARSPGFVTSIEARPEGSRTQLGSEVKNMEHQMIPVKKEDETLDEQPKNLILEWDDQILDRVIQKSCSVSRTLPEPNTKTSLDLESQPLIHEVRSSDLVSNAPISLDNETNLRSSNSRVDPKYASLCQLYSAQLTEMQTRHQLELKQLDERIEKTNKDNQKLMQIVKLNEKLSLENKTLKSRYEVVCVIASEVYTSYAEVKRDYCDLKILYRDNINALANK